MEQQIPCVCVTNRHLLQDRTMEEQLVRIAKRNPRAIVLREKDATEQEYRELAEIALEVGQQYQVPVYLHDFVEIAKELGVRRIQLPLPVLCDLSEDDRKDFDQIGTSVHSIEELQKAEKYGATHVFAGHIFSTTCKPDLQPRGLKFLKQICENSSVPVYAIGGIKKENALECIKTGAEGVCIMSGCMK